MSIGRKGITLRALKEFFEKAYERYYYNPALEPILHGMMLDLSRIIAAKQEGTSKASGADIYNYLTQDLPKKGG